MEVCVCGNPLRVTSVSIRVSPCRCPAPGPGPSQVRCHDLPAWVSRKQYEGRRKLGLPVVTPAEEAVTERMR